MVNRDMDVKKKPAVTYSVKKATVYRSFSRVCIMCCGEFRIDWYCLERKEPIGAYEQLVESHRGGDYCQKDMAEGFTLGEAKILKEYLWRKYSWGLSYTKYNLPISANVLVMNKLGEFSVVSSKKELRYVELYSQEGYDLAFKVIGYGYRI
jgi:hypothetical protein